MALGLASAVTLAAVACNHEKAVAPPVVTPGNLTVTLATPNRDDGAVMFELRGPNIGALASANDAWKVYADTAAGLIRVVVAGNIGAGGLLAFSVPDLAAVASYTATVVDVADRENRTRELGGYSLTIAP
jgi:hypothetical protein